MNASGQTQPTRELTLTRVFAAPRALVWLMWTEPRHVAEWWGPKGFTNIVHQWDARAGGEIDLTMRASDEIAKAIGMRDHPMTGNFHEVVAPERIVLTAVARDAHGNPLLEAHTTVTFAEFDGKTTVTVRAKAVGIAPVSAQMLEGMEAGWSQSLERLAERLAERVAEAAK
jgi:uncharacterized protein YndB with AHSA1/START domain